MAVGYVLEGGWNTVKDGRWSEGGVKVGDTQYYAFANESNEISWDEKPPHAKPVSGPDWEKVQGGSWNDGKVDNNGKTYEFEINENDIAIHEMER
jgi:hypothetical protein